MTFPTMPTNPSRLVTVNQANTTAARASTNITNITHNAGELLICIIVAYQSSAGSGTIFSGWTSGWTELVDYSGTTGASTCIGIAYKWATGSETGTVGATQGGTVTGYASITLMSIPGAHPSAPPEVVTTFGTGAGANPPSLTPTWGADDTLWCVVDGLGEVSTSGTFGWITAQPSGYTGMYTVNGADIVGGTSTAVAFRQVYAATEDPAAFTNDTSHARYAAATIAIRPSVAHMNTGTASGNPRYAGSVVGGYAPAIDNTFSDLFATLDSAVWSTQFGTPTIYSGAIGAPNNSVNSSIATYKRFTFSDGYSFVMKMVYPNVETPINSYYTALFLNDPATTTEKIELRIYPSYMGSRTIRWFLFSDGANNLVQVTPAFGMTDATYVRLRKVAGTYYLDLSTDGTTWTNKADSGSYPVPSLHDTRITLSMNSDVTDLYSAPYVDELTLATTPVDVPTGSASGTYPYSGAAVGRHPNTGSASGTYPYTGAATGKRPAGGTASGTYPYTGSATGKRTPKATASGTYPYTGTASGAMPKRGTAAGSYPYAGSAVGSAPAVGAKTGTASGTWPYSGAVVGKRTPKATASGTYPYTGTSVGRHPNAGAASGSYAYAGAAVGSQPSVGMKYGTASGTYPYTGDAEGRVPIFGAWSNTVVQRTQSGSLSRKPENFLALL